MLLIQCFFVVLLCLGGGQLAICVRFGAEFFLRQGVAARALPKRLSDPLRIVVSQPLHPQSAVDLLLPLVPYLVKQGAAANTKVRQAQVAAACAQAQVLKFRACQEVHQEQH